MRYIRTTAAFGCRVGLLGVLMLTMLRVAAGQVQAPPATGVKGEPASLTPDGQPDIRGTWRKAGAGTREKGIDYEPLSVNNQNPYPEIVNSGGVVGFKVNPRQELHTKDILRDGIIDLGPDGRLPWQQWAWQERLAKGKKLQDPAGLADVQPPTRCMTPSVNMLGGPKILQPPGKVVMLYEAYHVSRIIPLDGRPHVGQAIRLFTGNPRGRWEGNTLVVESANFSGLTWHDLSGLFESDAMKITERYTVTDRNTMKYEVTVDDPKLFTRPWTTVGSFSREPKETEFFEDSCPEGQVIGRQLESVLYKLGRGRPTSR